MECVICKNVTFHQDEQGNYFCGVCGTQSQDYFAESFELEENLQGSQIRSIKQKFIRAPKEVAAAPDTLDMLILFQHILKIYIKVVKSHIPQHEDFVPMVRRMWLRYLRLWHDSGGSLAPDKPPQRHKTTNASAMKDDSYHVSSDDDQTSQPQPPSAPTPAAPSDSLQRALPLPSPALLLAIIYVAIRQLRLSFLLCDMVHMLHSGELPLLSLLQLLPPDLTRHCTIAQRRLLVPHYQGTTRFPTVMNLWYHTTRVAELLSIDLAPLNSSLIALHMISKLGLPFEVYRNYSLLTHALDAAPCVKVIRQENQHHAINIMAAIVVSCKMVPNWSSWSYIDVANESGSNEAPVITSPSHLHLINSCNLDSYLQQVLATTRPTDIGVAAHRTAGQFSFNAIVSSYLESSQALQQAVSIISDNSDNDTCSYDTSIYAQQQARSSHIRYLRYSAYDESLEGKLLPAYTILLEHCAKYLCTSPAMLFEMVNTIDSQMFQCVTYQGVKRSRKSSQPEPELPSLPQQRKRHLLNAAKKQRMAVPRRDVGVPLQPSRTMKHAVHADEGEDGDVSSDTESDEAPINERIVLTINEELDMSEMDEPIDMTGQSSSDEGGISDREEEEDTESNVINLTDVTSIVEL